jgi:hypothetical protein
MNPELEVVAQRQRQRDRKNHITYINRRARSKSACGWDSSAAAACHPAIAARLPGARPLPLTSRH